MAALIGKKLGMTQLYNEKENLVPVTVVAAGPCPIVAVRTEEDNGYAGLQLAFEEVPETTFQYADLRRGCTLCNPLEH